MRVEKDKRKVNIICLDRSVITGVIHINPGERVSDFVNRSGVDFIIVTNAEFKNIGEVHAFKLFNDLTKKKTTVFLNKASIKWVQEV
jgi:hypothetical protein